MSNDVIKIRGARTHNLKNLDVDILQNKITCVAGPSGSGKSSLVFHTLLTESKRRFINSLPSDMKFFWEIPHTVDVDSIYPVLPAWGLPQYNPVINSRPVALDVLGGHERLQRIFMEFGQFVCPDHLVAFERLTTVISTIEKINSLKKLTDEQVIYVFVSREDYKRHVSEEILPNRSMDEVVRAFIETDPWYELIRVRKKNILQLQEKLKEFNIPSNVLLRFFVDGANKVFDVKNNFILKCPHCENIAVENKIANSESLSPLNALGACPDCEGHGMLLVFDRNKMVKDPTKTIREGAINFLQFSRFAHLFPAFLKECKKVGLDVDTPFELLPESKWEFLYNGHGKYEGFNSYFEYLKALRYKKNIRIYIRSMQSEVLCESCEGTRISEKAGDLTMFYNGQKITYKEFLKLNISSSMTILEEINLLLNEKIKHEKMQNSFNKLLRLYKVADDLGLGHIHNTRKVRSMSSSEYQRLLLSKYFSYEGSHSLFVLDEPSLGLSLKSQEKIVKYLRLLRDQGNTIIMVEHSEYLKSIADEVIEMGPGAGDLGGKILFQGCARETKVFFPDKRRRQLTDRSFLKLKKVNIRNLKRDEIIIQKNAINWASGESGSGKSAFLVHVLANEIHRNVFGTRLSFEDYSFESLEGAEGFEDVILINSSVDRISSRSTVATYTDLGGFVRKYYAGLDISKKLNLKEGHFSSNSKLGQCSSCEGKGVKLVEMHFMEDVEFTCEDCQGKKLKPYYADITDGKLSVYEAFNRPLSAVLPSIQLSPKGKRIWQYFRILKLDYLSLDRTLISLSGGERQRLQLLSLLDKNVVNSLIVFENLTSGLSYLEYDPVSELLQQLARGGNTIIVIDQNRFFESIADLKISF